MVLQAAGAVHLRRFRLRPKIVHEVFYQNPAQRLNARSFVTFVPIKRRRRRAADAGWCRASPDGSHDLDGRAPGSRRSGSDIAFRHRTLRFQARRIFRVPRVWSGTCHGLSFSRGMGARPPVPLVFPCRPDHTAGAYRTSFPPCTSHLPLITVQSTETCQKSSSTCPSCREMSS